MKDRKSTPRRKNPVIYVHREAAQVYVEQALVPALVNWSAAKDPGKPVGEGIVFEADMSAWEARDFRYPSQMVHVTVISIPWEGKNRVLAGKSFKRGGQKFVTLRINANLPPEIYLDAVNTPISSCRAQYCIPWMLYSSFIHELTHAAEPMSPSKIRDYHRQGKSEPVTEHNVDLVAYYNHPFEVRAYMQQIVDEAARYASMQDVQRAAKKFGGDNPLGWLVERCLKLSSAWEEASPHLTEENRQKIMKEVYQEVEKHAKGNVERASENPSGWSYDHPGGFVDKKYLDEVIEYLKEKYSGCSAAPVRLLGCGDFGCVLETEEPDIVLKITFDKREIAFAERMTKPGEETPLGFAQIILVIQNPADPVMKYGAGIWRERVSSPGAMRSGSPVAEAVDLFRASMAAATSFFEVGSMNYDDEWWTELNRWVTDIVSRKIDIRSGCVKVSGLSKCFLYYGEGPYAKANESGRVDHVAKLCAVFLTAGVLMAERIAELPRTRLLGESLLEMFRRGVLLDDVRRANLGMANRDGGPQWVLFDVSRPRVVGPKLARILKKAFPETVGGQR